VETPLVSRKDAPFRNAVVVDIAVVVVVVVAVAIFLYVRPLLLVCRPFTFLTPSHKKSNIFSYFF
jgi:hypothetical protein